MCAGDFMKSQKREILNFFLNTKYIDDNIIYQ